ncbi:MAG TPA: hypothetical protein VGV93_12905 [Acidimicrobiales bacterium]|nr:hypothetical protein [Acidimicrobiales bacterium]
MKNLLKKLSGADRPDRRAAWEQEAADRIKEVGSEAPPEASGAAWANPAPETTDAPTGRRLTVQERVAARELQNR